MNRDFHKRRSVVGIDDLHPLREVRLQFGKLRFNRGGGIEGIGAGSELNSQS